MVPSVYLVSTQLQLWLFCFWCCGSCWAVTISTQNIVMLWVNILCSHLQRFRKWKSVHDLSINNINDQNIGINLFMGTLYFCSILQGVYAPYSKCWSHLYRYALYCDSVCVLLISHLKLCHGCQSPFFVTLFCSHLYHTLIGQVFINLLPVSGWSKLY